MEFFGIHRLINVPLKYTRNLPQFTKRKVISDIASLFDSLGLLSPVIVKGIIFIVEEVDWNTPLSNELQNYWSSYSEMLVDVNILESERCILSTKMKSDVSYHINVFKLSTDNRNII